MRPRWNHPVVGAALTVAGTAGVVLFVRYPVGDRNKFLGGVGAILVSAGLIGLAEWWRMRRLGKVRRKPVPQSPGSARPDASSTTLVPTSTAPSGAVGSEWYRPDPGPSSDDHDRTGGAGGPDSSDAVGGSGGSGSGSGSAGGGGFSGDSGSGASGW